MGKKIDSIKRYYKSTVGFLIKPIILGFALFFLIAKGWFNVKFDTISLIIFIFASFILIIDFERLFKFISDRVKSVKVSNNGVEFLLTEIEAGIEEMPENKERSEKPLGVKINVVVPEKAKNSTSFITEEQDRIYAFAKLRIELERKIKCIIKQKDLHYSQQRQPLSLVQGINLLLQNELVSYEYCKLFKGIIDICNQAVHSEINNITDDEYYRILDIIPKVFDVLDKLLDKDAPDNKPVKN